MTEFNYETHPRVCCDYCGHQVPMSIQQMKDGYVPPSVCQDCAILITQQLEELSDEYN